MRDVRQHTQQSRRGVKRNETSGLTTAVESPVKKVSWGTSMTDASHDVLACAANDAVAESIDEMAKIVARVGRLTDMVQNSANEVRALRVGDDRSDPCLRFASQLDRSRSQVGDLCERQSKALRTFNIVLFGRTGAGKSTLISAMTRSNGASVSQGESDWTTTVEPFEWHSCRIYDTPGINGWGRTESREDLEARAREAVEIADFVLVCFDSQSQQADEFGKLAAWVHSYRKPMLAILNPRNPVWRSPPRVPVGSARANLSRAVREHAGNIRDELAKIGLTGVPVIAVSSKRALFARAELPFEGPDGQSLEKQRQAFGTEMLELWSDYPRFEGLLVHAISEHAVRLRIGALNDQLRGVFRELSRALGEIEREANQAAETLETDLVGSLLKLLGYPPNADASRRKPFIDGDRDLLAELERSRGGAFQAPVEGEFRQLVAQRLEAELGALRSRSLQNAEECVVGAFERSAKLSSDDVRKASFNESEMQHAAEAALREGAEFLERRVDLSRRDAALDLKVLARAAAVEGDVGSGWKHSSWAIKGGGILAGAAGALGTLAVGNIWNPLGWTAAAAAGVALVGLIAATALGWLGGKAREKAEQKRLAARRQALAEVRRNIHEVYDQFRDAVLERAHDHALKASREVLRGPIEHALVLRTVRRHCSSLRSEIENLSDDLPASLEPQSLLWEVATSLEREAYPERPNAGAMHWLGEDWIDDPTGLKRAHGSTDGGRTEAYDPTFFDRLFIGIKDIFDQVTEDVAPGAGIAWLASALERCADDQIALEALSELHAVADDGRPRIHVVGDYNAGKTSLIKRLLVDAGSPVPETLKVGANPTTDTPREYDWDGVRLIDSPGFQSGEATHAERALRAFPDSSAVMFLFQPNLILGDDGHLTTVLRGNEQLGLVPKQDRTFFIVNRSDELGIDPETTPDAYRQLADRKKTELSLALSSRGITVEPDRVFCMASDPYGLVGNRTDVDASAFDPYRAWDGFGHLMTAFRRARKKLLRSGADRSVLEGGLARLARLQVRQEAVVAGLEDQDQALARLQVQINEAIAEGTRLGAKHRADLEHLVTEHAAGFRDEVLAEQDPGQLKLKADRLEQWWNDEALQVELVRWANVSARALTAWRERSLEAIERRLESAQFRAAFGEHNEESPQSPDAAKGKDWFREAFEKTGRSLGGATRDVVYKIGKALGFKFKPWGAVKLAKTLGKVGEVVAIVGVGLDIADLFLEERRRGRREQARRQIARFLQDSAPRVVETVALGDDEDPGVLRSLDVAIGLLKQLEDEKSGRRDDLGVELKGARRKLSVYAELQSEAISVLGNPWEGR